MSWFVEALFNGCASTKSPASSFTMPPVDPCANHAAVVLTAPADKSTATSSSLTFRWNGVDGANGYRVWTKSGDAAGFVAIGTTTSAETSLTAIVAAGNTEWYTQALFDGCPATESLHFTFTVPQREECPTTPAALVAPANGASLTSGSTLFSWNAAPNAIGYEVWLALDNAAPSLLGSTTSTSLTHSVPPGNLLWFVRTNFDGCAPIDSARAAFTATQPPNCGTQRPRAVVPVDGDTIVSPADFRWSAVPHATQYKVRLSRNHAAPTLLGTTTSLHLDAQTLDSGSYDWWVEALFGNDCAPTESAAGSFIVAPPVPPCAPPVAPLLRAGDQVSSNVVYSIFWTRIGNASFYEYEESDSPSFSGAVPVTTSDDHANFTHANATASPIVFFYRVRMVSRCDGSHSLFSPAVAVVILPAQAAGGAINGATPAGDPQIVTSTLIVGGNAPGSIPALPGQTFTAIPNQPWITANPSSGVVTAGGVTITITADTTGLPSGTSTGAVTILLGTSSSSRIGTNGGSSSPTTISVNLVQPVTPSNKNTPPPDALIIPAVAHAGGLNANFQSDVRVANTAPQVRKYQITFTPSGESGLQNGKQATVSIDPGSTFALDDILTSWFGAGASSQGAIGTLEIRPLAASSSSASSSSPSSSTSSGTPSITTFAASRTYNTTANGTYGQFIPAIPFSQFIGAAAGGKTPVLTLQQIAQSQAYRTNLGLVEGSGDPATVRISVFGDDGGKLAEFTQNLAGGQHLQLNGVLADHNLSVNDGRVEVRVTSSAGKVTAYASVLDNATNDPLLVTPVQAGLLSATKWVIPGVADLNNGLANWRSDVRLFNAGSTSVSAELTYVAQGGGTQTKPLTIAPNEVRQLDGIVANLFGVTNSGGALHIATASSASLVCTARTYNQTANGTYGQFISAVTPADAVGVGQRALQILQVEESGRYRSNVGIAEVTGKGATVEITAIPPDSKLAVTTTTTLSPNEFRQYGSLLRSMGLGDTYNARVTVRVIEGDGKVTAYASVVDQQTQDPTFVLAQ